MTESATAPHPASLSMRELFETYERGWVVRWTMSGTLAESGEVVEGESAEAGARFEVDAVDVIDVADGKLTAKHTYVDSQALLRQLGE